MPPTVDFCHYLSSGIWMVIKIYSLSDLRTRPTSRVFADHNQYIILIRGNHNFMFLRSNSQKGQIIEGIDISYCASCFSYELMKQTSILHCGSIIHRRPDWDSFIIYNNNTGYTLVGLDSL